MKQIKKISLETLKKGLEKKQMIKVVGGCGYGSDDYCWTYGPDGKRWYDDCSN